MHDQRIATAAVAPKPMKSKPAPRPVPPPTAAHQIDLVPRWVPRWVLGGYGLLLSAAGAALTREPDWNSAWRGVGIASVLLGVTCVLLAGRLSRDPKTAGPAAAQRVAKPLAGRVPHRPRTGTEGATPRRPLSRQFLVKPRTAPEAGPVAAVEATPPGHPMVEVTTAPTPIPAPVAVVPAARSAVEDIDHIEHIEHIDTVVDAAPSHIEDVEETVVGAALSDIEHVEDTVVDAVPSDIEETMDAEPEPGPDEIAAELARRDRAAELSRLDLRAAELGAELERLHQLSAEINAQRNALEV